ncbi:hypothetical protein TNCT_213541 [Trichonephila clavata]|uniref:Uncharacterized protein n=1 Tax=Trichonephila clavata TaxID=2740835 RepID=A0A8X6J3Z0_TRICU|nr:hypothetical protein TNCT_213541 [Trichonephila clavata]
MKKLQDCMFFLDSTCLMGDKYQYRLCEQAKGTQIVSLVSRKGFKIPKWFIEEVRIMRDEKSRGLFLFFKFLLLIAKPYVLDSYSLNLRKSESEVGGKTQITLSRTWKTSLNYLSI